MSCYLGLRLCGANVIATHLSQTAAVKKFTPLTWSALKDRFPDECVK